MREVAPCNLHSAWDSGMINHTGMDVNAYTQHLQQLITANHMTASGNPADWANESHAGGSGCVAGQTGGRVGRCLFYNAQIQVVDKRLALAGPAARGLCWKMYSAGRLRRHKPPATTQTGRHDAKISSLRPDASSAHKALENDPKGRGGDARRNGPDEQLLPRESCGRKRKAG